MENYYGKKGSSGIRFRIEERKVSLISDGYSFPQLTPNSKHHMESGRQSHTPTLHSSENKWSGVHQSALPPTTVSSFFKY